jgi:hypothetical protein
MKFFFTLLLLSFLKLNAQNFEVIHFADIDTSTIEILHGRYTFANGNIQHTGAFRHIKLSYKNVIENYSPIGRHVYYGRNGKVKEIQNYTETGFLISDTVFRKNGTIKLHKLFQPQYSILESNGKILYVVDRFFTITFYFKNGNIDCEGLAESKRTVLLIRRDTWKFYKKDGTFKYEIKYKESELNEKNK